MNALNLPMGWTTVKEPKGSTHFARILDESGKFQGWLPRPPHPQKSLLRRLRKLARDWSVHVELPDYARRIVWGSAPWSNTEAAKVLAALAADLHGREEAEDRG